MKLMSLALGISISAGMDPSSGSGCGASAGSNTANMPDGPSTSAPAEAPCSASTHALCDDFSNAIPAHFDAEDLFSGTLRIGNERAATPPSALIATTTRITSGTRSYARLRKDFSTTGQRFTLAYSEWVDSVCIGQNDSIETGVIGLRQNTYWVGIRHGATSDAILEAGLANMSVVQSHVLRDKIRRDAWVRVVLEVDLAKKTIAFSADQRRVVEGEPLKDPPAGAQAPNIHVGILNDNLAAPPSPCTVAIDDVAFEIEP